MSISKFPTIPGYSIEKILGKGGMGVVYLAIQDSLKRQVALKVTLPALAEIDESFTHRFVREAQATAILNHPNIITIYDTGVFEQSSFMAMEYIATGTMSDLNRNAMSDNEIAHLFIGIACGLAAAHKAKLVHRDIKPDNILINEHGQPLVTDFGIVKSLDANTALTMTGRTIGTPKYMSPEQILANQIDGRSDLYSVGIMLFDFLEGKVPFNDTTPAAIHIQHIQKEPPPLSVKNQVFQPIVTCLLMKDKHNRYKDANALIEALKQIANNKKKNTHTQIDETEVQEVVTEINSSYQSDEDKTDEKAKDQTEVVDFQEKGNKNYLKIFLKVILLLILIKVILISGYWVFDTFMNIPNNSNTPDVNNEIENNKEKLIQKDKKIASLKNESAMLLATKTTLDKMLVASTTQELDKLLGQYQQSYENSEYFKQVEDTYDTTHRSLTKKLNAQLEARISATTVTKKDSIFDDMMKEISIKKVAENSMILAPNLVFKAAGSSFKDTVKLNKVANGLLNNLDLNVEVQVHTDSSGPSRRNQQLSQNRANAIKQFLINKGIEEIRIKAYGKGESLPIASNETKQGRAKNRRIEITSYKRNP